MSLKTYVWTAILLCVMAIAYTVPTMAQAADDTTVVVPWGDTLAALLLHFQEFLTVTLLGLLSVVVAKMPSWVTAIMGPAKVEQLLTRAIDYAISTTAGAVKGQEVSVQVGNELAAKALRYAIKHGPKWLIDWAGGQEMLAEKIVARIDVIKDGAIVPPK